MKTNQDVNIGMDPTEDQINNWKMGPRDCIGHKRKYQKEEKWNTNATPYAEAIQMFIPSKRNSR